MHKYQEIKLWERQRFDKNAPEIDAKCPKHLILLMLWELEKLGKSYTRLRFASTSLQYLICGWMIGFLQEKRFFPKKTTFSCQSYPH